jgi:protein O-GlcNAc transferase
MPAPEAQLDQARQLLDADRPEQARALLAPLVARYGSEFRPTAMLVEALAALGQSEPAEFHLARLLQRYAHEPDAWTVVIRVRLAQKRFAEADAAARKAIELDPRSAQRYRDWSLVCYADDNELGMAEAARLGSLIDPADADLSLKHATGLLSVGHADESVELFRAAVRDFPDDLNLAEGYAVALNYGTHVTTHELRTAHDRFGELTRQSLPPLARAEGSFTNPPPIEPGRPLRVGILSPDFRRHSVAAFAHAILAHHDRALIDLFIYSTWPTPDAVTAELRALVAPDRWLDASRLDDDALADRIRADRLHALVDLAGLFQHHRQGILARRPAPVQFTHIGYPATTGLATVDFRIVDALTDPPPAADAHAREQLIRLDPCFLCYRQPVDVPPITWSPPSAERPPTVGCFNMLSKVNDQLLATWAELLRRVPGTRLLLKARGLAHPAVRADLLARAARAGIPAHHIEIAGYIADQRDHLNLYNRIDLALDTFPYHGTTTTCEALLMGVPVLTIAGDRHASRVGVSLLSAIDAGELITPDPATFLDRAAALLADPKSLAHYRQTLPTALRESRLTDALHYGNQWSQTLSKYISMSSAYTIPESPRRSP